MVDTNHYTLTLPLRSVKNALKTEWDPNDTASLNLAAALVDCIKSRLGKEYGEKVAVLLSSSKIIPAHAAKYTNSCEATIGYLAGLYPDGIVLVDIELSNLFEAGPDITLTSLHEADPAIDNHDWGELKAQILALSPGETFDRPARGYDAVKKIKHLKVTAKAHLNPCVCVFDRDISDWGPNFSFSRAVLRLCNLQDLPFEITKQPSTTFRWSPVIVSGGGDKRAVLRTEVFAIEEAEEIEMEAYPDLLCLEKRFSLKPESFMIKGRAYQAVVSITCKNDVIGSIDLNFINADAERSNGD